MRLIASALVLGFLVGTGSACTSDLPAPDNYSRSDDDNGDESDDGTEELEIDCAMPPTGAVSAAYSHQVEAAGGVGPYTFSATGLDPLTIAADGTIAGIPDTAGTLTADIRVVDSLGNEANEECDLPINPHIVADLPETKAMPCVVAGESFGDFVDDATGDGSPLTCTVLTRNGDGVLPAGITVDPETCTIEGSVSETRYGTYAWIVEADQNGAKVHLPYCATQTQQADPNPHAIFVDQDGSMTQNGALVPGRGTFSPGQTFAYGDMTLPRFEITGSECSGTSCYYGWRWGAGGSPFTLAGSAFQPVDLLRDANDVPYGFSHQFHASGEPVDERFETRPWVVNLRLDYCLSDQNGPCNGSNVTVNGKANLNFAVVMFPE